MMFIGRHYSETNDLKSTIQLWSALTINASIWGVATGVCAVLGGSVDRKRIALAIIAGSGLSTLYNLHTYVKHYYPPEQMPLARVQFPISLFAINTIHLLALRHFGLLNNTLAAILMTLNIVISGALLFDERKLINWNTVFPRWNPSPVVLPYFPTSTSIYMNTVKPNS